MNSENTVTIVPFTEATKEYIKILNIEWLTKYFKVEPHDEIVLGDPQSEIIAKGGYIFYAKYRNNIVGTVSLLNHDQYVYELSKMAVTEQAKGLGVGNKLLQHCMQLAQDKGFKKLVLYSNTKLYPALHLYRKYGFVEVPLVGELYERADIKMEKIFK